MIKINRSNKHYSARLTRRLDPLIHFSISIQHSAGSNLKFTDYLSCNPVGAATPEENYAEEYVINILTEQAKLNIKYGPIFADQSKCDKAKTETQNDASEEQNQKRANQSHTNRTFENKYGMIKKQQNEKATSLHFEISTLKSICSPKEMKSSYQIPKLQKLNSENTEMDRKNFYHRRATREIMEIIRRRNNSPETRRLIEQRNELFRPGKLPRRNDHYTLRTVFGLSRPNERNSRD